MRDIESSKVYRVIIRFGFIFSFLYFFSLTSCSQKPENIFNEEISVADYEFINQELSYLRVPELNMDNIELKYKFVHKDNPEKPVSYYIYAGKISDDYFPLLIDSLKTHKILINESLSEHIMFRFKLGDGKNFNIKHLRPSLRKKKVYEANKFNEGEGWVNRINSYYFYRDFTVYRNPEKTRRKHKEGKLVLIDLNSHYIVYYSDYINYK